MLTKRSKCSKAATLPVVQCISVTFLISVVTQLSFVDSIPIQPANSKNNYIENHAKRQLPNQPPPQWERPPSFYKQQQHFQQAGQNQGPEMEDFERLYTNKNHFRRHAMPPDGKATPGNFHQNAPETFGAAGRGTNLHHNALDESNQQQHPMHSFRFQPPPHPQQMSSEDAQEFPQRPFLQHNVRRKSNDAGSFQPPSFSNSFDNSYREEDYHHIPNPAYQPMLNDNEIPRERYAYQQSRPNTERESNPGQWQTQQQQRPPPHNKVPTGFMDYPGHGVRGESNNEIASSMPQPHPTAIAVIAPAENGMRNSTLFIEYDISDNDVTYETLVEIEDPSVSETTSNYNSLNSHVN